MKILQKIILLLLLALPLSSFANIDVTDKWAWGEGIGWLNFSPVGGGAIVSGTGVTGSVWSSNYGWIYLAPSNGGVTLTNSIVNTKCTSTLGGNAWGNNLGWIDFSGVFIDDVGNFYGTASGSNSGDISFSGSTFQVETSLIPNCSICTAGSYQALSSSLTCIPAPIGYYVPSNGAISAIPCAIGTFTSSVGSSTCTPAPTGYYIPSTGASSALQCTIGTFSSNVGSSVCSTCPSGFTSSLGASSCSIVLTPTSSGGESGSSPKYDKCEGNDTSGSIYDGSCGDNVVKEKNTKISEDEEFSLDSAPEREEKQEYLLEETFETCPSIGNIKNPDYKYSSGIFIDEEILNYKQEILKFKEIGIINGYEDGSFQANNYISRIEFLKIVLKTHCYSYVDKDTSNLHYIDVNTSGWQTKVIAQAKELKIINGDTITINKELIDKNLGFQYNLESIEELKRIFHAFGLYNGNVDGYFTKEFTQAIYDFQISKGIISSEYDAGAGFWGPTTRKVFFETYSDKSYQIFRPNDILSKAEATKILMNISHIQAVQPVELGYIDITTQWHKKYIRTGESLGLFNAQEDNYMFSPNDGINRGEVIHLIDKLIQFY